MERKYVMTFTLIEVSLIIAVIVVAVEFVSRSAFKRGQKAGIAIGKAQILSENIIRTKRDITDVRKLSDVDFTSLPIQ
jgi:hypothetical protein